MTTPGLLIAFEGIDGAGKTTQVKRVAEMLHMLRIPHVVTKQPTDGPWGRRIRESATTKRMSLEDELHAFMEDRKEHVRDFIGPALQAGKVVLIDRYYPSTVAYQGARGADPAQLLADNEAIAPRPDVTLLFRLSVDTALGRVDSRGEANAFEGRENLEAVDRVFAELQWPGLVWVDAEPDALEVYRQVFTACFGSGAPGHELWRDAMQQAGQDVAEKMDSAPDVTSGLRSVVAWAEERVAAE